MADNQNDLGGNVGLDVSGFKTGITELNRQIRVIDSGFKAAAAGMEDWGKEADGLKSRIDTLGQITELQKKKVAALSDEYKKSVAQHGENSKATQDYAVWLNKETGALNKSELELRKCTTSLEKLTAEEKDSTTALNNNEQELAQNAAALDKMGKEAAQAAEKSAKLHDALGKMGTNLKHIGGAVGKAALVGIAAIGAAAATAAVGAFKLAEKASDLAESQNVVQQTFKQSSTEMLAWTKTVAGTAGISETNATKFAGSMGAMLMSSGLGEDAAGDMSKGLVQLTGDMSSFYNLDNDTAWEKLRAGIAGETEPLKELGINMSVANMEAFALSQGVNKSWKEMTQAEQTTMRYQYLMKTTANAQGDFGRTLETSFPNQLRVAQMQMESMATSVGQKFLPSFLGIFKAINEGFTTGNWAGVGKALSDGLTTVIGEVSRMATTALPVLSTVLSGVVGAIATSIPTLLPVLTDTAVQLLGMLVTVIQENGPMLIQAGINALMTLIDGLVQALPQITDAAITLVLALVMGLVDALPKLIESAIKMVVALVKGLIKALPELIKAAPKIIQSLVSAIIDNLPLLIDAAIMLISELVKAIILNLPMMWEASLQIMGAIVSGIIKAVPQIATVGLKLFNQLVTTFKSIDWGALGKSIIDGITNGVKNAAGNLANSVVGAAQGALGDVKNFLGIHSPSRVMRDEVGAMIGAGMAQGISNSARKVQAAMNGLNAEITASPKVSASGTSSGSGTIIVNVPLALDGHILTTATGRIQLTQNRIKSRSLGIVPI